MGLVNRSQVKDYYGITSANHDDDLLLDSLIDRVSSLFRTITDNVFASATYTHQLDGNGLSLLYLPYWPVTSITSIYTNTDWDFTDSEDLIDAADYRIDDGQRYVQLKDDVFPRGKMNIQVIYVAGHTIIPSDIEQVCIEEVIRRFKHRKDFDVTSKTQPDGSVNYVEKGLLTSTKDVLAHYYNYSMGGM